MIRNLFYFFIYFVNVFFNFEKSTATPESILKGIVDLFKPLNMEKQRCQPSKYNAFKNNLFRFFLC